MYFAAPARDRPCMAPLHRTRRPFPFTHRLQRCCRLRPVAPFPLPPRLPPPSLFRVASLYAPTKATAPQQRAATLALVLRLSALRPDPLPDPSRARPSHTTAVHRTCGSLSPTQPVAASPFSSTHRDCVGGAVAALPLALPQMLCCARAHWFTADLQSARKCAWTGAHGHAG